MEKTPLAPRGYDEASEFDLEDEPGGDIPPKESIELLHRMWLEGQFPELP